MPGSFVNIIPTSKLRLNYNYDNSGILGGVPLL